MVFLSLDRDKEKENMLGIVKNLNFIMIKISKNAWECMMVNGNLINLMEKEHYHFLKRKK